MTAVMGRLGEARSVVPALTWRWSSGSMTGPTNALGATDFFALGTFDPPQGFLLASPRPLRLSVALALIPRLGRGRALRRLHPGGGRPERLAAQGGQGVWAVGDAEAGTVNRHAGGPPTGCQDCGRH